MKSVGAHLGRHGRLGTVRVATALGVVGLGAGTALVTAENADLVFGDPASRVAAVALLASALALAGCVLYLPVELALGLLQAVSPRSRSIRLGRFYLGSPLAMAAAVAGVFAVGFRLTRDVSSPRARAMIAGLGVAVLLVHAVLLAPRRGDPDREERDPGTAATILTLALLVATSVGSARTLAGHHASAAVPAPGRGPSSAVARGEPPAIDVLLVSIDTLRADHLGVYGYGRPTTPHLDALAGEGTVYLNARSAAPWTLPSHVSLLTGLYPTAHGVRFRDSSRFFNTHRADRLAAAHVTLAETLRAAGYRTVALTSSAWLSSELGLDQGFDRFEMDVEGHTAGPLVDEAIGWLEEGDDRRPTFAFLHFFDVHQYTSPPRFVRRFATGVGEGAIDADELRKIVMNLRDELAPEVRERIVDRYDAALAYVDEELGRLFERLRATGRLDRTLVVVTSDHGEEFWDHGGMGHGFTLYDEMLRVPLIVRPPGGRGPRRPARVEASVSLVDVVPTVLDFLGRPAPGPLDGISLGPTGPDGVERDVFAEAASFPHQRALVRGDLKYIGHRFLPEDLLDPRRVLGNLRALYGFREDELYRLSVDPGETEPVHDPERARSMLAELRRQAAGARPGGSVVVEDRTFESLRALGYVQ